jgi:DprA winged helix domain
MAEGAVLLGRGAELVPLDEGEWWRALQAHAPHARRRFEALPPLHRRLRRSAVLRLVATGRPVPAEALAAESGAPLSQVVAALAELESRLFFLVRDGGGAVSWAFPVTADATPHHLAFSTGERLDAA